MAYDPTIPIWPDNLRPKYMRRGRVHPVNFGPETITGPGQSVASDAGRHKFCFRETNLFGDRVLTMRALVIRVAQRKPIYITPFDGLRTPRYRASVAQPAGVPFSDGSMFSDTTTFYDQPTDFVLASDAAARAMTIDVTRVGPSEIELVAGNYIGFDDRLYMIEQIFAASAPNTYTLSIWPYLRYAVSALTPAFTEVPMLKCLATRDTLEVDEVLDQFDRFGKIDLDFEEAPWT